VWIAQLDEKERPGHAHPEYLQPLRTKERCARRQTDGGSIGRVAVLQVDTPHGPARAHLRTAKAARAALILGHGAGGGVDAPDLTTAGQAAGAERISVALVEQPYRVAGRRSPPRVAQLDTDWLAVVERLRAAELTGLPLIVGGRSLGARVACRTAEETGASAVLCLAFPLEPPRRAGKPKQSRLAELDAVKVPTLVVQGERDPFGIPPPGPLREVVTVPGDHGLKADLEPVAATVQAWLAGVLAEAALVP
jgi:predicted alpha/beta-hydrolase family hydrolase